MISRRDLTAYDAGVTGVRRGEEKKSYDRRFLLGGFKMSAAMEVIILMFERKYVKLRCCEDYGEVYLLKPKIIELT